MNTITFNKVLAAYRSVCCISTGRSLYAAAAIVIGFAGAQRGAEGSTFQVAPASGLSTIRAAILAAAKGDTILVHAGTYREDIIIRKAGLEIQNYPGDAPVLEGRVFVSANNVSVTGLEITAWRNLLNRTICAGIYATGISGLKVQNCVIHDAPQGLYAPGIYLRDSTKITLERNEVYRCTLGIKVVSAHSTDNSYEKGIAIRYNLIHDNPTDGVQLHGECIQVLANTIYNNIDAAFASKHPDGIQLMGRLSDGYNAVHHCIIMRNLIKNHTQNIFTEGSNGGDLSDCADIHIASNVVYNESGWVNGADMDSINSKNILLKESKNVFVFNNTLGACKLNAITIANCSPKGTIHIKNNIFATATGKAVSMDTHNAIAFGELNYNFYGWNLYFLKIGSKYYTSLSSLPYGFETAGLAGNPKVDSLPDATLSADSRCIGKGRNLGPGYSIDVEGNVRLETGAWDIGAYAFRFTQ